MTRFGETATRMYVASRAKESGGHYFQRVHRGYVANSKDLWLPSNAVENASLLKRHQVSATAPLFS